MNCKICLEDKNENSSQFIDYFLFSNMLFAKFDEDKVKKILTILKEETTWKTTQISNEKDTSLPMSHTYNHSGTGTTCY